MMSEKRALVWFRRDLRARDHAALYHALKQHREVLCLFVFDTTILSGLTDPADRRVDFIWRSVVALQASLRAMGGDLIVCHAQALRAVVSVAQTEQIGAVYCNHDDEPQALQRDALVKTELAKLACEFHSFKDHVVFERSEVLTQSNTPFSVFTPYKNAWLKQLTPFHLKAYPVAKYQAHLAKARTTQSLPSLRDMGFCATDLKITAGEAGAQELFRQFQTRIALYGEARDFPSIKGPSYLSVHLRFGTISIRQLVAFAHAHPSSGAKVWLSELIWRDFYHQVMSHRPDAMQQAFKPAYDKIVWGNNPAWFAAWCAGQTGYPLVDAAMLQLNQSGYMHNRLRMVVASFLCKDLQIDWRWGESYFAAKLLDFDLAANNGGWQWASSSGCDSQPYFRIFNPITQSEKFDSKGQFIRRYLPELASLPDKFIHAPWLAPVYGVDYPKPIVEHATARNTTLLIYQRAVKTDAS